MQHGNSAGLKQGSRPLYGLPHDAYNITPKARVYVQLDNAAARKRQALGLACRLGHNRHVVANVTQLHNVAPQVAEEARKRFEEGKGLMPIVELKLQSRMLAAVP